MNKRETVFHELKEHLPFTFVISLIVGGIVAWIFLVDATLIKYSEEFFDVLHPVHILFSAAATSAIYYKYCKNLFQSIIIGIFGAILVGTISDVLFPYISGNLFLLNTSFHLPIFEVPFLILGVALVGSVAGIYFGGFKLSHNLHVLLSILASLFYLLAFSFEISLIAIFLISLILFLFVFIPCCISDIVFPILFLKKPCRIHGQWHEH
ncbi:MAG: hypothetical protein IH845_05005 [Nanoarchaeota archaeon]|nr:hypothetical protein [Nanoarchaeota archaeon]